MSGMVWMACRFTLLLVLVLAGLVKGHQDEQDVFRRKRAATTVAELQAVVETLSQKVETLSANLIGINDELQAKLYHSSQKRDELEDLVRNSIRSNAAIPKVSFHATYEPDLFVNNTRSASDPLVVNNVVTNEGQAYDSVHGVFTAPFNGTYVFFVNDAAEPNYATTMQLNLMVDGKSVPGCVARTTSLVSGHSQSVSTGNCQVVIRLQAGQAVRLQNLWDNARYWGGMTTFGGVLVHLD